MFYPKQIFRVNLLNVDFLLLYNARSLGHDCRYNRIHPANPQTTHFTRVTKNADRDRFNAAPRWNAL
jgi:hypothetical protein